MSEEQEEPRPEKDESTECIENKLRELREHVRRMEQENQELYEKIGIGPHQVEEMLQNRDHFSEEVYNFIKKEREALEDLLQSRLDEVAKSVKRDKPEAPPTQGHWIFVK